MFGFFLKKTRGSVRTPPNSAACSENARTLGIVDAGHATLAIAYARHVTPAGKIKLGQNFWFCPSLSSLRSGRSTTEQSPVRRPRRYYLLSGDDLNGQIRLNIRVQPYRRVVLANCLDGARNFDAALINLRATGGDNRIGDFCSSDSAEETPALA